MRSLIRRFAASLLCAVMLLALFGCSKTDSGILPVSFFPSQPQLADSCEVPYGLPVIVGTPWAAKANASLAQAVQPVISALHTANAERTVAHTEYTLDRDSDGYRLGVYITGVTGYQMHITDISLTVSGKVAAPDYAVPDVVYDGDYLNGLLRLSALGVLAPVDDGLITREDIVRLCVDYYEAYCGSPVDTSVLRWSSEDEYYMKAIVLGLTEKDYDGYISTDPELISAAGRAFSALVGHILTDCLGRSSLAVSRSELAAAFTLFLRIYFPDILTAGEISEALSEEGMPEIWTNDELVRLNAADIFCCAYERLFSPLTNPDPDSMIFYDEVGDSARNAIDLMLMDYFPSYGIFSETFVLRGYQLAELAQHCADSCWWNCVFTGTRGVTLNENGMTARELTVALGLADEFLDRFERPEQPAYVVDNSRSYDWYYSQYNTGKYSAINCMPTICAMAIKWYDPESAVTVSELRDSYLWDNDSGWYMSQVFGTMDDYDIPYSTHSPDESITDQLDRGCIVLTQMSEAEFNASGHCFVIYGYRRLGDSVQFMIHDPGISPDPDDFGKYPGEAMLLDSEYVYWIIQRIAYVYLAVGGEEASAE